MPPSPVRPGADRPRPARRHAERGGRRAEALAALYLRLKGYGVLARRFKTPVGEIDLVMRRGTAIVFVEVKARRAAGLEGEALESVNQRRITRAAQYFIARNERLAMAPMRFDVIFLAPFTWPRHVKNAFPAA